MSFGNPFNSTAVPSLGHNGFEVSLSYIAGIPDANLVADPQLKIIFKSLGKNNEKTKEKALSDLVTFVTDLTKIHAFLDDLVLLTWVQLYPKLAIDTAKAVRSGAHTVQSRIVATLGKLYAKYLKDTAPVWLAGTYDTDRIAARETAESLRAAFGGAQAKVDRLWTAFRAPIVNFVRQVVQSESRDTLSDERYVSADESAAKYARVAVAAISMFSKLLSEPMDDSTEFIQILRTENIWENLLCGDDLALKKACYGMISVLAQSRSDLLEPKVMKLVSKNLVKSLKIKADRGMQVGYAQVVLPIFAALIHMTKLSSGFWTAAKKPRERLLGLMELGSCGSDPAYYDYLFTLLSSDLPEEVLSFAAKADAEAYLAVVVKVSQAEKLALFQERAWICLNNLFLRFHAKTPLVETMVPVWILTLATASPKNILKTASTLNSLSEEDSTRALDPISDLVTSCLPNKTSTTYSSDPGQGSASGSITLYSDKLCPAYFHLLQAMANQHYLEALLASAVDSLAEYEEGESPTVSFTIVRCFLTSKMMQFASTVLQLISDLPQHIETNFFEEPMALLIDYNPSNAFYNEAILVETLNDAFLKIVMISEDTPAAISPLAKFLKFLPQISRNIPAFETKCPEIFQHVHALAGDYDFATANHDIFQILSPDVVLNLFDQAWESGNQSVFVANFLQAQQHGLVRDLVHARAAPLLAYLWETLAQPDSCTFLRLVEAGLATDSVLDAYVASIHALILSPAADMAAVSQNLYGMLESRLFAKLVPMEKLDEMVTRAIGAIPDPSLAVGNPLESNVYLVQGDGALFSLAAALELTRLAQFILNITSHVDILSLLPVGAHAELMVNLGLAGEVAADATFLTQTEAPGCLQVSSAAYEVLKAVDLSLEGVVSVLGGASPEDLGTSIISALSGDDLTNLSFYKSRVLQKLVLAMVETESAASFNALSIPFPKLLGTPLKLAAVVLGLKKFLTLPKFDRTRNAVAAELIGLPLSQVMLSGLQNVTLLNNFVVVDDREGFVPLPPQRFNMIVTAVAGWLESEIAYDPEFGAMRSQLCNFFTNYVSLDVGIDTRVWEMCTQLCRDTLGVAATEAAPDMEYHALKLFLTLHKHSDEIDVWADEKDGLYEELIEVILTHTSRLVSQPLLLCQELLIRIFDKMPTKASRKHYGEFLTVLETARSVDLQRVAADLLHKAVLVQQQEFVIEYELQSSSVREGSPDSDPGLKALLPSELIAIITEPPLEYVEHAEPCTFSRYVWSWLLVFDHFKNITYKIRQQYIVELKARDLISGLLDFIFQQVDIVADVAFVKSLTPENIRSYHVINYGAFESTIDEFRHLLVHFYYLVCKYLGAHAQTWFLNIRDRQLKASIEKFSIRYVSSSIVTEELAKAEELLTGNNKKFSDENLTIKVNKITNEIRSVYLIDEQTMEMVIRIPASFPLVNVTVEGPQRLGVKETQWKAWLLASQLVITSQNGTILESIELFNRNVTYHFSGFEECAICYSILHQDHSLPSRNCQTCSNKFHSACLYKWFKSSGSSTCPLCRATFNFRVHK
ncbi:hypothetical protein BABINDRAFT_10352 [Babjeviella inositovora NRRL Y-12698]|uniref:E3 ubiquitin-protein ligase listerin n=1 Tax=Babjeviella inositovora NRRL Y-12698 TaxID=984486 RepID=A0A1E3QHN2_9ASCO|nr:uncharacterized protein BABINDRAFT_10352 [Babjeviella inositovora NRRL Y-12698]ODQ77201.1 hypothetical protein BABINDRAFT_10352 [Babjeviella inositovora NRRL Y-12698]